MVRCDSKCRSFLGIGKAKERLCVAQRDCVCSVCSSFLAINYNLYEACAASCNVDGDESKRPKTKEDFLAQFTPEVLYNTYKYVVRGFDPLTTIEGKKNKEAQDRIDSQQTSQRKTMIFLLVLLAVIVLLGIVKKM